MTDSVCVSVCVYPGVCVCMTLREMEREQVWEGVTQCKSATVREGGSGCVCVRVSSRQ